MRDTSTDEYELRPFQPGDTAPALRLAAGVHGMHLVDPGMARGRKMMESLCQHPHGWPAIELRSPRTGKTRRAQPHSGGRMAASGKRRLGFYTLGSPVPWVRAMPHVSLGVKAKFIEYIAEVQVLAVHPQAQGQGIGTVLADHAEQAMTAAGARVALAAVIDTPHAPAVLDWWTKRGYTFTRPGTHWAVVPWADRDVYLEYDADEHLYVGLKPLAPRVHLRDGIGLGCMGAAAARLPQLAGLFD